MISRVLIGFSAGHRVHRLLSRSQGIVDKPRALSGAEPCVTLRDTLGRDGFWSLFAVQAKHGINVN